MSKKPMNLAIAINRKYVRYAYVMLTSFLINNPNPLHVYVFHHEITTDDECTLQQLCEKYPVTFHFIYVPDELLPSKEVLATSAWGPEAYFRLAVTDLMPADADRVLYLDSDILILNSVEELYFCDLGKNKIAACPEFLCKPPFGNYRDELFAPLFDGGFSYVNSGVVLYDLNALRGLHSFRTYMNVAKELNYRIQYPDQDLLNYCHYKETLYVDTYRYNLNARHAFTQHSMQYEDIKKINAILHYASSKPWRGNYVHCNIDWHWWEYAKQTPFYTELLQEAITDTLFDTTVNSYIEHLHEQNNALYAKIEHYDKLLSQAGIQLS